MLWRASRRKPDVDLPNTSGLRRDARRACQEPYPPRRGRTMTPTTHCRPFGRSILSVLALLLFAPLAVAQTSVWRLDYNAARKEATEKNRPLVIDFVTDNCVWCKKLDATTLQDPAVLKLLGERFVPLKIDAERDTTLATKLQIQVFPTVIIA